MPRPKPPSIHLLATPDEAEAQFYEALRDADLDKLMAVWSDEDEIVCVHPGGPRLVGPRAIRASFETLFGNGHIDARPQQVKRVQLPDAAMHNLVERFDLRTAEGPRTAYVLATNVYHKTALGWRLVAHHASPGTDGGELAETDEAPGILH
jgi:ketosteroid isomerase-like protein